ncbi:MAG TPA: PDZ domain-containing protein [Polyangiaceae bacterium]|nr:PDZ domain-containing protein [Polyangiaceae bacterium]
MTSSRARPKPWALTTVAALVGAAALGAAGTWSLLDDGAAIPSVRAETPSAATLSPESAPAGQPSSAAGRTDLIAAERRTIDVFRRASPSVVHITRLQNAARGFRMGAVPAGTGSGFVWDDDGHIVTNYHVIRGASGARVTLGDRSTWDARLVGRAVEKDLAVLKIDAPASKLKPLKVATSGNLLVGQHVLAIGNPFGLDQTLSTGVISGLGREIKSVAGHPIAGVIQTDAAINPGNSGGPLLDSHGRLIGVNTAIFSPSGASAGVGFAVPADTVARIVPQLIEHGQVVRPGLGIEILDGRQAGVKGVLVMRVMSGSGAEAAGLLATRRDPNTGGVVLGDVITAVDGKAIADTSDLFRALDRHEVGETVTVRLDRGGKSVTVVVKLQALTS